MERAVIAALALLSLACPQKPFSRAEALEQAGKLDDAAKLYVQLAKADPANLGAWDRAVDIQCRRRVDVGACMSILELELDLLGSLKRHHDALGEVLERRARARLDKGMVDAALEDIARAEKAAPGRAGLFVVRAKAYAFQGKATEAHRALMKARTLAPGDAEVNALFAELPAVPEEQFGGTD